MGLDTSFGAWSGPYSSFHRWRCAVAKAAGHDVSFYDTCEWPDSWPRITSKIVQGEWDETPDDPLLVLLAHSDCDGAIYPAQAGPLADALEALLPKLPDDGDNLDNITSKTVRFIRGLRLAVKANKPVEFC